MGLISSCSVVALQLLANCVCTCRAATTSWVESRRRTLEGSSSGMGEQSGRGGSACGEDSKEVGRAGALVEAAA